jgi:predicted RNA binding protein YcfA (HicA-like mRNA interferase family)
MSQQEKLVERLLKRPKDFGWDEMERLLQGLGYEQEKGSGSRRKFFNPTRGCSINLHQPHPRNELKSYQVRELINHLKQEGLI